MEELEIMDHNGISMWMPKRVDYDGELPLAVEDRGEGGFETMGIAYLLTKQDAVQIVDHLSKVFQLGEHEERVG